MVTCVASGHYVRGTWEQADNKTKQKLKPERKKETWNERQKERNKVRIQWLDLPVGAPR